MADKMLKIELTKLILLGAPFVVATESFTSLSVVATLKLIRTLSIFFTEIGRASCRERV